MPELDRTEFTVDPSVYAAPGGVALHVGAPDEATRRRARIHRRPTWILEDDAKAARLIGRRLVAEGLADVMAVRRTSDVLRDAEEGVDVHLLHVDNAGSTVSVLRTLATVISQHRPTVVVTCSTGEEFLAVDAHLLEQGYRYVTRFGAQVHVFAAAPTPREKRPVERSDRRSLVRELLTRAPAASSNRPDVMMMSLLRRDVEAAEAERRASADHADHLERQVAELRERLFEERFRQHETVTRLAHERAEAQSLLADARTMNRLLTHALDDVASPLQSVRQWSEEEAESADRERVAQGQRIAELEKDLTIAKGLVGRLRTAAREGSARESELKTKLANAQSALARFEDRLDAARAETAAVTARVRALKNSATYRTGELVRDLMRSPSLLVRAPRALRQIAGDRQQQRIDMPRQDVSDTTQGTPTPSLEETHVGLTIKPALVPGHTATAALKRKVSDGYEPLRVAAIMDDFTARSFDPECELTHLLPQSCLDQLESSQPQLLFIESAWRGKDDAWGSKVAQTSREVRDTIRWCRERGIPTMLWNKEDPVHYTTFLNTAKLVDAVFTTDFDCIQTYKAQLGHDQVYLLPFASQPTVHNPLTVFEREDAFCFAGAYYQRYPERTKDLESFVEYLPEMRPFRIYDRNLGRADSAYQFPAVYAPYIVGTLSGDEIDMAYKGFTYAINLNSVKESQTMFARRVFELLASNTITVSNYSRGLDVMFGDLTVHADSGQVVAERLSSMDGTRRDWMRLAGLRKVMTEHTYADRLSYVLRKLRVGDDHRSPAFRPRIHVFSLVSNADERDAVLAAVRRQVGVTVITHLFADGGPFRTGGGEVDHLANADGVPVDRFIDDADAVAYFSPVDHYGPHYLLDLALARRYSAASVAGKATPFRISRSGLRAPGQHSGYVAVDRLAIRSSLVFDRAELSGNTRGWLISAERGGQIVGPRLLSTDPYNYCRNGAGHPAAAAVDDQPIASGIAWDALTVQAESVQPAADQNDEVRSLSGVELGRLFHDRTKPGIDTVVRDDEWAFHSSLGDGRHDYLYSGTALPVSDVQTDSSLRMFLETTPGLNIQLAILFFDGSGKRVGSTVRSANQNHTVSLPEHTEQVRLGVRVFGSGEASIKRLLWGHRSLMPAAVLGDQNILIVTNAYPSYSQLYRNGFVHTRARGYERAGRRVEVFVYTPDAPIGFREYDGVSVITGGREVLQAVLAKSAFDHVMVHFLNRDMWETLLPVQKEVPVSIWVHGSDVQPWTRRPFLYPKKSDRDKAQSISVEKMAFWNQVLDEAAPTTTFIFVSQWLVDTAMEDLGRADPPPSTAVIHNPIDVRRFEYQKKRADQRLRVLSIRPYASTVYANDLTVEAIHLLSRESFFDQMEFRLVGEGPLFETLTASLRKYSNVVLDERFLTPAEIAQTHRDYGIFLCPSRMDTQGVSRDEAMASGLVPVVSNVGAVTEFVDSTCGRITGPEDANALAAAVAQLVRDPQLFQQLSRSAAERVRRQSSETIVIPRELSITQLRRSVDQVGTRSLT